MSQGRCHREEHDTMNYKSTDYSAQSRLKGIPFAALGCTHEKDRGIDVKPKTQN